MGEEPICYPRWRQGSRSSTYRYTVSRVISAEMIIGQEGFRLEIAKSYGMVGLDPIAIRGLQEIPVVARSDGNSVILDGSQ